MLPRPPICIWGPLRGRGAELGRGGKGEGKEGPKLLLNQGPSQPCYASGNHGRRKRGVCRGCDIPNYLCGGDIDMYIPLEKPNT